MKALYIGGTGVISPAVGALALARGWELTLLNRGTNAARAPRGARVLTADIHEEAAVKAALGDERFDVAVDFIAQNTRADGILSIKPGLIQRAKAKGLITIQRFFLLDSIALKNIPHQLSQNGADLVEVLPGAMPKAIAQLAASIQKPIIAGGMIRDKEDVTRALSAGAVGISASNETIWGL